MSSEERIELLQRTLDLIVLRALSTMGPVYAYALAGRRAQVSEHPLPLGRGTLDPALMRLGQKGCKGACGRTEGSRDAKFSAITRAGRRAQATPTGQGRRPGGLLDKRLLDS